MDAEYDREALRAELADLMAEIKGMAEAMLAAWRPRLARPAFDASAHNLAHFLALRSRDRIDLQRRLRRHGLSTLGRSEAHVRATLQAVVATLSGRAPAPEVIDAMVEGQRQLDRNAMALFGPPPIDRSSRILVTLSPEVALDRARMSELLRLGANAVRINCAHHDPKAWREMAQAARAAARATGLPLRVLMDLAGPKLRTSAIECGTDSSGKGRRLQAGDRLFVRRDAATPMPGDAKASCACTLPQVLDQVAPGAAAAIDDGKIWARVEAVEESGLWLQVARTRPGGAKLKGDKGLNFPGTELSISPLTDADRAALEVVVEIADLVGYSFVQRPEDVDALIGALEQLPARQKPLGLIAKIETELAFRNLPQIIAAAAGQMPFGVMIARGDLGVEVGFPRLSEVQEEILWLCEAAHVPVVWATEVLANLVKNGMAARGEFTDAAMASRAECVMLNKGPFLADGVRTLADVLRRAERHVDKKTPQLAHLRSWQTPLG